MNVTPISKNERVKGLSPQMIPAELVAQPELLVCGSCGFIGRVTHYVFTDEEWCYEPVCYCPIEAVLTA